MESDEEAMSRFITFVREVAVGYAGKTVLLVTHGGVMRAFLIKIGFGTYDTIRPGAVQNSAYVKMLSDGVDFFISETQGIRKVEEKDSV